MSEIRLVIQGELTDLNTYINAERSNRHIAAKIKKDNTETCQWELKGCKERLTGKYRIAFTWYTKDERKDPDNVSFAKKFILDSMVRNGILPNDGRKNIKGFSDDFETDSKNPRTEIMITEVPDEKI
jgi:hypothetical protein